MVKIKTGVTLFITIIMKLTLAVFVFIVFTGTASGKVPQDSLHPLVTISNTQ